MVLTLLLEICLRLPCLVLGDIVHGESDLSWFSSKHVDGFVGVVAMVVN